MWDVFEKLQKLYSCRSRINAVSMKSIRMIDINGPQ